MSGSLDLQPRRDLSVMTLMLRSDYGNAARGRSVESVFFEDNLRRMVRDVTAVYSDDFADQPAGALHNAAVEAARATSPDLIFAVLFQEEITTALLDELGAIAPTVVWFCDDSWRFHDHSSRFAPHFTHVVTTDVWRVADYRALGIEPILSQWASQPPTVPEPTPEDSYDHEVSFVGLATPYRKWFISHLAKNGVDVECFGYGWPNGKVGDGELEGIWRRSRINLNITNSAQPDIRYIRSGPIRLAEYLRSKKRGEQIKARNFEIPGAGGFQLTNYPRGLERYFEIGREVAIYSDPDQSIEAIRWYLAHEDERFAIARDGFRRTSAEHTYPHRLSAILDRVVASSAQIVESVGAG